MAEQETSAIHQVSSGLTQRSILEIRAKLLA